MADRPVTHKYTYSRSDENDFLVIYFFRIHLCVICALYCIDICTKILRFYGNDMMMMLYKFFNIKQRYFDADK